MSELPAPLPLPLPLHLRLSPKPYKWRSASAIRGNMSQLIYALGRPNEFGQVLIDDKTARNLIEICRQAIHTEVGHETIK